MRLSPGAKLVQTRRSIDVEGLAKREGPNPAFIVLGGQKCGTTLLYECLNQHPLVARGRRRETHFFDWAWPAAAGKGEGEGEGATRAVEKLREACELFSGRTLWWLDELVGLSFGAVPGGCDDGGSRRRCVPLPYERWGRTRAGFRFSTPGDMLFSSSPYFLCCVSAVFPPRPSVSKESPLVRWRGVCCFSSAHVAHGPSRCLFSSLPAPAWCDCLVFSLPTFGPPPRIRRRRKDMRFFHPEELETRPSIVTGESTPSYLLRG